MFRTMRIAVCIATALPALALRAEDRTFHLDAVGLRYGFGANKSSRHFDSGSVFTEWTLPLDWDVGPFKCFLDLEIAAGGLGDKDGYGAFFETGPILKTHFRTLPVYLQCGLNTGFLTRTDFDSKDLGYPLEFTTYAGLGWDFMSHFSVVYRYQHTSNAGLGSENPGLNMHAFSLSYRF